MKREAGYLAMLAFLVTGLRFAGGPAASKEAPEEKAGQTASVLKMPAHEDTSCKAFDYPPLPGGAASSDQAKSKENAADLNEYGGIAMLIDRYLSRSAEQSNRGRAPLPEHIKLMIATTPDPLHTHLNLQFDRTLEALQEATQDEHYNYDSSWLPWRTKSEQYSSLTDREAAAREKSRREACPGVVLFRRSPSFAKPDACADTGQAGSDPGQAPYQCGLIVFVVGERPTAGLNRMQWDNTFQWIYSHLQEKRKDKELRILGPNFSGSMPSLVRALEDVDKHESAFDRVLLYTGRIRGCGSWQWLKKELLGTPDKKPETPLKMSVQLADFEENDSLQSDRFLRYLTDQGHRLSEIALISEDETTYGGLPDAGTRKPARKAGNPDSPAGNKDEGQDNEMPCGLHYPSDDRPVHLYYPRDISAIRSAYQEQSIFSSQSKSESSSPSHTVLQADANENAPEETDTIEPFSGNNRALTEEAQLYGVVNTLQTHGIRYIILRSTNSLDYLFLARFLHRAYPTAYIVTIGSDLLFTREIDSTEFRGILALSTFPLTPRGQDWTRQTAIIPQHAHRVFGSFTMEGAYVAARFLLYDHGLTAEPDTPDYARPFWERNNGDPGVSEPATWLTVIGRDGYWPVATLTETLEARDNEHLKPGEKDELPPTSNVAMVRTGRSESDTGASEDAYSQHLSLSISWRFVGVLAVLLFGLQVLGSRLGYKKEALGGFVQFDTLKNWRWAALMGGGWTIICSLLLVIFLAALRIGPWLRVPDRIWVGAIGIAAVVSLVLAVLDLCRWRQFAQDAIDKLRDCGEPQPKWKPRAVFYGLLAAMVVAIVFFATAAVYIFDPNHSNGVITAYRAVHLTSGVSPLVPLIALLGGSYWWFWQALSGLALMGDGRPTLPRSRADRALHKQQEAEFAACKLTPEDPRKKKRGASKDKEDKTSEDEESHLKSDRELAKSIEDAVQPFPIFKFKKDTIRVYTIPLVLIVILGFLLQRPWMPSFDLILHSLENEAFNQVLHGLIALSLYIILLECTQFYFTWLVLKRLLSRLDRLPLRRTFAAMQGLSMRSLWKLSGTSSRSRAKIFSRQIESLIHLQNELNASSWHWDKTPALSAKVAETLKHGKKFMETRRDLSLLNNQDAKNIRVDFSKCAETIFDNVLEPQWTRERCSLEVQDPPAEGKDHERIRLSDNMVVRSGEEFVCLIYVGFLQNLLGRMRTMVQSMVGIFAAIAIAVGFYPYTPRPTISLALLCLLLLIGTVVGVVFAGLDRDGTLSHITNTDPGELGLHFWLRMISFVGVPAMGLIVAQFPEITDFVFSWVQPTMSAIK